MVKDHAAQFTNNAVSEANARLHKLADRFGVDLVVVTVELPDAERKKLPRPIWQKHDALMSRTREEARNAGIDGLYVVIYVNVPDTCVVVYPESRDKTINAGDREDIRKTFAGPPRGLLSPLIGRRQDNSDNTLVAGVDRIQSALQHPGDRPAVAVLHVLIVMAVLLALWLLLALIRRRLKARQATGAEQTRPHGNRVPALLGAMFGLPAALPAYDRLLDGGPQPSAGEDPLAHFFATPPSPGPDTDLPDGEGFPTPGPRHDAENVQVP
jgi:hypothetical protein